MPLSLIFNRASYYFNPYAVPVGLMGFFVLLLAVYVFNQNRRSAINFAFLILGINVHLWLFGVSMIYLCQEYALASFWYRYYAVIGVIFLPSSIYFFTTALLEITKQKNVFIWANYLVSLFFLLVAFTTNYLVAGVRKYYWGWYPNYGIIGSFPFLCFFFFLTCVCARYFIKAFRGMPSGFEKNRIRLTFIGLSFAYFGVLDFLPGFGIGVYPFGYIAIFIFILFIYTAMIKYRLMVMTPALAANTIIDTMADSLVVFNPQGNILMVNRVTCESLGYKKDELVGKQIDMLFAEKDLFRGGKLETLIKNKTIHNYDLTYLTKNNNGIPISFNAGMIKDDNGLVIGIVGIARDIRETKKLISELEEKSENLEEKTKQLEFEKDKLEKAYQELSLTQSQLVQSAKMAAVGQLGAGVAHELNNPLGGILGYAQFMLDKLNRPDFGAKDLQTSKKFIESIERESLRCKQIVSNLLRFSRKALINKPEATDIGSTIEETVSIIAHQLSLSNINIIIKVQPDLAKVNGIASFLQQVFINLILNAQQAMANGGTLTITAQNLLDPLTKAITHVKIEFTDTGCGISEQNLVHIFEPFFTTKQKEKSIGLGLSVSYQIIQDHKGKMEVKSQVGQGTTFTIILPVEKDNVQ